jgi:segregation and condensation protein A
MTTVAFPTQTHVENRHERAARLVVDIDGFEGPLDLLLTLARDQKVDLANISMVQLADQYLAFIADARNRSLDLAAEYLVMAAWLAYLKSRILLPEPGDGEPSADDMAKAFVERLRALESMREAGAQIMARSLLGRDVFARGRPEGITAETTTDLDVSLYELLQAYAANLARNSDVPLTFEQGQLFSVDQALERLSRMMGLAPEWQDLRRFLPPDLQEQLVRRSAMASTFAAILELARLGRVQIRQASAFAPIFLRSSSDKGGSNG